MTPFSSPTPTDPQPNAGSLATRPCTSCAHHVPPGGRLDYPVCRAPAVATDPVSGRPVYGMPCARARRRTGRCGIGGQWWQAPS